MEPYQKQTREKILSFLSTSSLSHAEVANLCGVTATYVSHLHKLQTPEARITISFKLQANHTKLLEDKALALGYASPHILAKTLLTIIIEDDMFEAILDEG